MGQGYLADTNVIIDYLDNKLPDSSSELIDSIEIKLSVISRIELLVWRNATGAQLKTLNDFIDASTVFDLNEAVILKSIEVRKNYRLKLADAIIAATAISNDLILITRNIKDFDRTTFLKCVNSYKL